MSFTAGDFYKDLVGWAWIIPSVVLMRNWMLRGVEQLACSHTAEVGLELRSTSSGPVLFLLLPTASTCPVMIL